MVIRVERKWKKENYTISNVYLDGTKQQYSILEDKDRGLNQKMGIVEIKRKKVFGATAIPAGEYEVVITHSYKFNRELPLIKNVPGFDGIRIHPGNTIGDTQGCLLPGKNTVVGQVTSSRVWFERMYKRISEAMSNRDKVTLLIG